MALVVLLTLPLLICQANSQFYGPGFPGPRGIIPGLNGPPTEINGPSIADPYATIQAQSKATLSTPAIPYSVPTSNNIPTQPYVQNQIAQNPNNLYSSSLSELQLTNLLKQVTPPLYTNPVLKPAPTSPTGKTAVVDNTLANSLANAIQLLIFSNLIDKSSGSTSGFVDSPCINNYEVVVPDYYTSPVSVDCSPCVNEVSCCEEPVVYQTLCAEFSPCTTSFGKSCGSSLPIVGESNSLRFDNFAPNSIIGTNTCSNVCSSPSTSFVSSYGCTEPATATLSPMAVEVPFPASIPAQLVCNFGYMPTNVPCVSVNVEPLPIDGCRNVFGNVGKGFAC